MADEKQTKLSIIIATVDRATAKLKQINDRLDAITKPLRDFKDELKDLREKSGLDDVIGGFKGVGDAVMGIVSKVAIVGGVIGVAVAGVFKLIDGFDDLGDKAEAMGVSVDFLAQMRYAAERSGASVESLDAGIASLSKNLGLARANSGPLAKFLGKVSPELLKQVKAAKSNEEAFDVMAAAFAKLEDPAKRAAAAQKLFGDASLGPLLAKGPAGIKALRDEYFGLAGSQQEAADEAGKVDDELKKFKASTDGLKASIVTGLAPALGEIVKQLTTWFAGNRGKIAEWAAGIGKKLPAAFDTLVGAVKGAIDFIKPFVDSTTKLKLIAVAVAAVIVGPLVAAIYGLGVALLTTPVGWITAGLAAIALAAVALMNDWGGVATFFSETWETITGGFTWAKTIIKLALAPIIGFPLAIASSWGAITGFFKTIWDGITGIFSKAGDIIGGIIEGIREGIEWVSNAVDEFIHGTAEGREATLNMLGLDAEKAANNPELAAYREKFIGRNSKSEAKVTVDFKNVPAGTRVATDPQSTATVDTMTGYQLGSWGTP